MFGIHIILTMECMSFLKDYAYEIFLKFACLR